LSIALGMTLFAAYRMFSVTTGAIRTVPRRIWSLLTAGDIIGGLRRNRRQFLAAARR